MSKAKFQYARELINEKRYLEAKLILEEIDHPTAKKWIQEIDKRLETSTPKAKGTTEQVKTKSRSNGCLRTFQILGIFFVAVIIFSMIILSDQRAGDFQFYSTQSPTEDITSTMIAIEPIIEIIDSFNTGIPDSFLQIARLETATDGHISYYSAEITGERRFAVDIEIELHKTRNNYQTALNKMEQLVKLYFQTIEPNTQGSLRVHVSWEAGDKQCNDNLGVGYRIMQNINIQTASQEQIFKAMDKSLYNSNTDGTQNYIGDIAFSPDPSVFAECKK